MTETYNKASGWCRERSECKFMWADHAMHSSQYKCMIVKGRDKG